MTEETEEECYLSGEVIDGELVVSLGNADGEGFEPVFSTRSPEVVQYVGQSPDRMEEFLVGLAERLMEETSSQNSPVGAAFSQAKTKTKTKL